MPTLIKNIAEQLQQEHQMIGAAANKLQDLVGRPVSARERESDWLNSVRDSLNSLNSHLKTHFAFEEFGGFMEEVVGASPNASREVDRLKQDHQTILAKSEELCQITRGGSALSETSQLRKRILRLLELLNRHEHAENELVQCVLMDDLGTTD